MTANLQAVCESDIRSETAWLRLDPRMVWVNLSWLGAPVGALLLALVATGGEMSIGVWITVVSVAGTFAALILYGLLHTYTVRYRLTDERLEERSGLVFRRHRSIPRDRIRTVDLTAGPLYRVFGVSVVTVGTGQTMTDAESAELKLDAVSHAEAGRLREVLLSRAGAAAPADVPADGPIAVFDRSWIKYGPLTIWGVGGVLAAAGVAFRILKDAGVKPWEIGFVQDVVDGFSGRSMWFGVGLLVAALVVLGTVVSTVTYVEGWWGFRLEREQGGTFRVRRGLLTTRSVSLEESRLRGVEIAEPMLLRWGGGARAKAVATGMKSSEDNPNKDALLPPAPRADAHRVAAAVLGESPDPTAAASLRPHPRSALRRRLVRAVVLVTLLVAPLFVLGVLLTDVLATIGWIAAAIGYPVALLVAVDAYRSLGHAVAGGYLVTRFCSSNRRTVALQRNGVIGWVVTRSYFQRRAGLLTLGATTAAGNGIYRVYDVSTSEGLTFAEDAVPELLAPFLTRR